MALLIRIPRLYPEMEEATVGRWLLSQGQSVQSHEPIVEIITDKVSYEIEASEEVNQGKYTLLTQCAAGKSVVATDSIIAVLIDTGEDPTRIPDWKAENDKIVEKRQQDLSQSAVVMTSRTDSSAFQPAQGVAGVIRATPAARRAAKAAGIALEDVAAIATGTTVQESDVERFLRGGHRS